MRQDHSYLIRSGHSTQKVVIKAVQQVAKAIDGSLPARFGQARSSSSASAAVIRGITVKRFNNRALKRIHWVYVGHGPPNLLLHIQKLKLQGNV